MVEMVEVVMVGVVGIMVDGKDSNNLLLQHQCDFYKELQLHQ